MKRTSRKPTGKNSISDRVTIAPIVASRQKILNRLIFATATTRFETKQIT